MRQTLSTDALLRDVVEADLPIFYEQQLDPVATSMAAFPARKRRTFLAHWKRILRDENVIKKTILYEGQVAGNIVSFEQSGDPMIGYWLGQPYWGKGLATRALTAFLQDVKVRPLYAYVAKHNAASIRVLQKCGFTIHGMAWELAETPGEAVEEYIMKLDENTPGAP